jgi:hypothetical protein
MRSNAPTIIRNDHKHEQKPLELSPAQTITTS